MFGNHCATTKRRRGPLHGGLQLLNLLLFLLCTSTNASYSCSHSTIPTATPTILNGGTVVVNNCTFNAAVTIMNPDSVHITDTVFKAGLIINGSLHHTDDEDGKKEGNLMTLEHVDATEIVVVITADSPGHRVAMKSLNTNAFIMRDCHFSNGGSFMATMLSIQGGDGLQLMNVNADNTLVRFVDSTVNAARSALLIEDGAFSNGAQLVFENSTITAEFEAVFLRANSNKTGMSGRAKVRECLKKTGHCFYRNLIYYYFHAGTFRSGSILNFTNAAVVSKESVAIRSYEYTTNAETYTTWFYHRYFRFVGSGKLLATNSRFVGEVHLLLREGSSAELDSPSYQDVDLMIEGDSEEHLLIPVPHTINAASLRFSGCRAILAEGHAAPNSSSVWYFTTTLSVTALSLFSAQYLQLRGGLVEVDIGALLLTNESHLEFSELSLQKMVINSGVAGERSVVSFANVHAAQDVTIQGFTLQQGGTLLFNHSRLDATLALESITANDGMILVANNCTLGGHLLVRDCTFSGSGDHQASLSISNTTFTATKLSPHIESTILVATSIFNGASLCLRDVIASHSCHNAVTGYGVVHFVGGTVEGVPRDAPCWFSNGSSLIVSNSIFRCDVYHPLAKSDLFTNMQSSSSIAPFGSSCNDQDVTKHTTVLFSNTTFEYGFTKLLVQRNMTNIYIDNFTADTGRVALFDHTAATNKNTLFGTSVTDSDTMVLLLRSYQCRALPPLQANHESVAPSSFTPTTMPTATEMLTHTATRSTSPSFASRSRSLTSSGEQHRSLTTSTPQEVASPTASIPPWRLATTATISDTVQFSTEPPPTHVGQTPSPPKRVVDVATILLPNEEATTVVLSTAGASGAVASTIGSGGGGAVVVAGASLRIMECGLAENDPRPAAFELPIQFAVGSGVTRFFAGAVVAHTSVHVLLFLTMIFLRRSTRFYKRNSTAVVGILSMVFCGAHAYFTPAILGAAATVLANDTDSASLAAAGLCALLMSALHLVVILAIHVGPQHGIVACAVLPMVRGIHLKYQFKVVVQGEREGSSSRTTSSDSSSDDGTSSTSDDDNESSTSNESFTTSSESARSTRRPHSSRSSAFLFSGESTLKLLQTLFDGCRVYKKASHRHYASIEITLFSVIAIISGSRPREHCTAAAFAMGGVALLHLLYVVCIRPFRTALDTGFSIINSIVLLALAISVAVAVDRTAETADSPPEWSLKTMEACLWLVSVLGFAQLIVQGYWAYHVLQRRRHIQEAQVNNNQFGDSLEMHPISRNLNEQERPLLTIQNVDSTPSSSDDTNTSDASTTRHNPLIV